MIGMLRWSGPYDVGLDTQSLLLCANCVLAARSYVMSSKHSNQTTLLPSGHPPHERSWTVVVFRSPDSVAAILKSLIYPELLGLVTTPKPSGKAPLISVSVSSMTSHNYGTWISYS